MADGKLCKKCGEWKFWDDFPHNHANADDRDHRCRACIKIRDAARVQRSLKWLREYKQTLQCIRCGEDHPAALDFHHRDPSTKRFSISVLAAKGRAPEAMRYEIAKCDVLCSNCHRKEHFVTRQVSRSST